MSQYPYTKRPPMDRISELRARIQVLEWEAITGETPTWYCYQEIDVMEREIQELHEIISDGLMNETRKVG